MTLHVVASVGWLGAVATFLGMALAALASTDVLIVIAVPATMNAIARWVLVPLSVASLVTGLLQSLTTPWGLFRHYWVVFKLVINVVASVVLLLYVPTLTHLDGIARGTRTPRTPTDLADPSPALHSGAALVLLVVATVLSIYKPRGLTPYGYRVSQRD